MITQAKVWHKTEAFFLATQSLSYIKRRKLFEALYREAKSFGVLPPRDPLEGLEGDLRLARALNRLKH